MAIIWENRLRIMTVYRYFIDFQPLSPISFTSHNKTDVIRLLKFIVCRDKSESRHIYTHTTRGKVLIMLLMLQKRLQKYFIPRLIKVLKNNTIATMHRRFSDIVTSCNATTAHAVGATDDFTMHTGIVVYTS